jgi:hypothetical protein
MYCKELACSESFDEHKNKGCNNITFLACYMKKDILPKYKAEINNLKKNA